jgi:predicted metal-dependent hydrolase
MARRHPQSTYDMALADGARVTPEIHGALLDQALRRSAQADKLVGMTNNKRVPTAPSPERPRDELGRPLSPGEPNRLFLPDFDRLSLEAAHATAMELFDRGNYFGAHEGWETCWNHARGTEDEALFKGLAQLGAGCTHWMRTNSRGAAALVQRGLTHIDRYDSPHRGIDIMALKALMADLEDSLALAARTGAPPGPMSRLVFPRQGSAAVLPGPLRDLVEEIEDIEERTRALLAGLDEEQANRQAVPGQTWSITQCLDHLRRINLFYVSRLMSSIEQARRRGGGAFLDLRPGFVGGLFVRSLEPPARLRTRSHRAVSPAAFISKEEAMEGLRMSHLSYRALVRASADLDVNRVIVPNPFLPALPMRLSTALLAIPAHDRRHLWQAGRVLDTLS